MKRADRFQEIVLDWIRNMWPYKKKAKAVGGFIGLSGLSDWWLEAFDEAERLTILATYQPLGARDGSRWLVDGKGLTSHQDTSHVLSNLAGWFKEEAERTIAYRIIEKAEELLPLSHSVLTKHFTYQANAQIYYRWREVDDFALANAEKACKNQIELAPLAAKEFLGEGERQIVRVDWLADSEDEIQQKLKLIKNGEATTGEEALSFLPSHHGFKQLAIILEKRGHYQEAFDLCEKS